MKKTTVLFLLTFAFATSLPFAQGPGNPPNFVERRVRFLTTLLTLTSAQQQQATTIFTEAVTANATLRASLRAARQTLQTDIEATPPGGVPNTAKLQADTDAIAKLEGQLAFNNANAEAQFYAILTSEQQTKLNEYQSQGRGRFGGMGGPGPGGFRRGR